MLFHLDRALDGVTFTVKHDFIRGWEVRDERVFRYVTGPYFETRCLEYVYVNFLNITFFKVKLM